MDIVSLLVGHQADWNTLCGIAGLYIVGCCSVAHLDASLLKLQVSQYSGTYPFFLALLVCVPACPFFCLGRIQLLCVKIVDSATMTAYLVPGHFARKEEWPCFLPAKAREFRGSVFTIATKRFSYCKGAIFPPPLPPYSLYPFSPVSLPFPKPFTHH